MDDILKVIFLALIEGLTEFLPVSSTGHLIVGKALLDFDAMGTVFEIFIQFGAVVAVVVYFRDALRDLLVGAQTDPQPHGGGDKVYRARRKYQTRSYTAFGGLTKKRKQFWLLILLAALPAGTLGFLLDDVIEAVLFSPVVVGFSLIIGGVAFLAVERLPRFRNNGKVETTQLGQIQIRQALVVGIVQALALVPGMSRSGTTIVGGMLAGMNRRLATEFSFFLAIPILGGATLFKLLTSLGELQAYDLFLLLLGAILSAAFAWLAIDWLLKFVSQHSFVPFGYYRILAGLLVLAATANGLIA